MAISRLSTSRVTQGLPKFQSAWDIDNVASGAIHPITSMTVTAPGFLTYSGIPQTFQDLIVVINGRANTTNNDAGTSNQSYASMYFNNNTNSIHSMVYGISNGTSNSVSPFSTQSNTYIGFVPNNNASAGVFGTIVAHIMNYKSNATFKHVLSRSASDCNGSGIIGKFFNTCASLDPITSIAVYCSYTNFAPGTTISLYGVRAD